MLSICLYMINQTAYTHYVQRRPMGGKWPPLEMENIFISHFHSSLIKVSALYRLRLLLFAALEFYAI